MHTHTNFQVILLLAAIACVSGCDEQLTLHPVAGKVLIDGKPLTSGSIKFVSAEGPSFASKIGQDGSFRLAQMANSADSVRYGVPAGHYRIGVSSIEILDEDKGEAKRNIPGHYADPQKSKLNVEVTGPRKDLIIELTWKGFEDESEMAREVDSEGSINGDASQESGAADQE